MHAIYTDNITKLIAKAKTGVPGAQLVERAHHVLRLSVICSGGLKLFEGHGRKKIKWNQQLLHLCNMNTHRGHYIKFYPLEGHHRRHLTTLYPLRGHPKGHLTTFCPLKGHVRGHLTMFCPLEVHKVNKVKNYRTFNFCRIVC